MRITPNFLAARLGAVHCAVCMTIMPILIPFLPKYCSNCGVHIEYYDEELEEFYSAIQNQNVKIEKKK